ncbi:hypothetical protein FSP39_002550 [Pinctada imbricata]|uniref:Tetraspanin n=1 Tax=Pinctada imbricata TaxID=66713 RepID=A0AA88YAF3_PINIB|nr:hypothetical protein FSP39_002550 [Pinctada imbricata]
MDCCTGFARFLLIFFNIIFILSGIGVLGVGIFVIADPDSKKLQQLISVDSTDQYLKRIAYVLIGFGSFVLLVGLLGFLAGLKRWKFAIILYIMFLVVIFIGELGGGIAAAVFKSKVEDGLKDTLGKALQQYNGTNPNAVVTKAWDAAQKDVRERERERERESIHINHI